MTATDRYGGNEPDLATICQGQCDGMGCYPVAANELNKDACEAPGGKLVVVGQRNGKKPGPFDGWFFVQCPTCGGTGKRQATDRTPGI